MRLHLAYVQSWAESIKDAPNELFAAIRDAGRISDYLILNGEFLPRQEPEEVMQIRQVLQQPVEPVPTPQTPQPPALEPEL